MINYLRKANRNKPGFWINADPVCFRFPFQPDVDAVYITDQDEIQKHLASSIRWQHNEEQLQIFLKRRKIIFLHGTKK